MKKNNRKIGFVLSIFGSVLMFAPASSAEDQPTDSVSGAPSVEDSLSDSDNTRFKGEWPKKLKNVTVSLEEGTVAQALQVMTKQLGWGLVITDTADARKRITLQLKKHPAPDVLEILLQAGNLDAELKGSVLFITPSPEPVEAAKPVGASAAKMSAPDVEADPGATGEREEKIEEPVVDIDLDEKGLRIRKKIQRKIEKKLRKRHEKRHGKHEDRKERVLVGQSLRIEADEEVDEAVVVGGSLTVAGVVHDDAVAVGGSVTLEPGALVEGNAVAVGGKVDVQPGATLQGDRVGIGGPIGSVISKFALGSMDEGKFGAVMVFLVVLGKMMRVAVLLVMGILILTFMPDRYARVREYLTKRPGKSALTGMIMFLATVPLCILFGVTVIGIPLIPFLVLALLAFMVVGLTAFLTWLGDRIPIFKGRKSPVGALAIGAVLFLIVSLIPMVGTVVLMGVSFVAAGAAFMTRFGAPPKTESIEATATPSG